MVLNRKGSFDTKAEQIKYTQVILTVESVWTAQHLRNNFPALSGINMIGNVLESASKALWSMLLLGGEKKTERLCHSNHTDESSMTSMNPETKQKYKVLMLKDRVQAIEKSQGQSVQLIAWTNLKPSAKRNFHRERLTPGFRSSSWIWCLPKIIFSISLSLSLSLSLCVSLCLSPSFSPSVVGPERRMVLRKSWGY